MLTFSACGAQMSSLESAPRQLRYLHMHHGIVFWHRKDQRCQKLLLGPAHYFEKALVLFVLALAKVSCTVVASTALM